MTHKSPWFAAVVLAGGLILGGCAATETSESEGDPAATVEEVPGSDAPKITLTAEGARRLQVRTASVAAAAAGTGVQVPHAAVVYDTHGAAWVYTTPSANVFVRSKVTIAGISGDVATLSVGPTAGTQVVTVGTAELLGAEAGLGA
jgi:hypothetical protein